MHQPLSKTLFLLKQICFLKLMSTAGSRRKKVSFLAWVEPLICHDLRKDAGAFYRRGHGTDQSHGAFPFAASAADADAVAPLVPSFRVRLRSKSTQNSLCLALSGAGPQQESGRERALVGSWTGSFHAVLWFRCRERERESERAHYRRSAAAGLHCLQSLLYSRCSRCV